MRIENVLQYETIKEWYKKGWKLQFGYKGKIVFRKNTFVCEFLLDSKSVSVFMDNETEIVWFGINTLKLINKTFEDLKWY